MQKKFPAVKITGVACDITSKDDVNALVEVVRKTFPHVHLWINNTGVIESSAFLWETKEDDIKTVVTTNLYGSLITIRAAINLMKSQNGYGHIFLMDGGGSNGMATPTFTTYGATKSSFPQLRRSINSALKQSNIKNVTFHLCSPGIVFTDLLNNANPRSRKVFNILGELPITVAAWLVPRIRGTVSKCGNSLYIRFLTTPGAFWRFATAFTRK